MYMQRIEIPAAPVGAAKPPALKALAGLMFVLVGLLVMAPWVAALSLWVLVAGLARGAIGALAFGRDLLLYAGEVVIGR